ncbi:MAG TPA: hypothetical protein VLX91_05765 [Candidatus Acidoferrales bacterium]|nr:hypothetical protein [Candidatus Acidoferrales bacterium]
MRFSSLPGQFVDWFENIISDRLCHVDIMQDLRKSGINIGEWRLQFFDNRHLDPLGRSLGWLNLPEAAQNEIVADLEFLLSELFYVGHANHGGLVTAFCFLKRLTIGDNIKSRPLDILRRSTGNVTPVDSLNCFLEWLNKQDWFPNSQIDIPTSLETWESLFRAVEYADSFSNPVELFEDFIEEFNPDIDYVETLSSLQAVPRTLLASLPTLFAKLKEQRLINFLEDGREKPDFWIAYFYHMEARNATEAGWFLNEVLEWILKKSWIDAGRLIFRRTFGSYYRRINAEVKSKLEIGCDKEIRRIVETVDDYADRLKGYVQCFEWPEDFEAFAGWISWFQDRKMQVTIEDWVIESICDIHKNYIAKLMRIIPESVSRLSYPKEAGPSNIFESKAQLTLTIMLHMLLHSTESTWSKWKNACNDLLHVIEDLFYGSNAAQLTARKISDMLILLSLSFCNLTNKEEILKGKDRIQQLLEMIHKTILFPYTRISERDSMVWDSEDFKPNPYINQALYLLNTYLHRILKDHDLRSITQEFEQSWRDCSTTEWPWMRDNI